MEELLQAYGYPALFIAMLLEGESFALLAGVLAQRGLMDLPVVMAIAFAGTLISDQVMYYVGRMWGPRLVGRFPRLKPGMDRAAVLLRRYDIAYILLFRWLWGLRTVSPPVIGMAGVPPGKYLFWNIISVGIWAVLFPLLGYWFGRAIELFLADLKQAETFLFAAAGLLLLGVWVWRLRRL